MLLSFKTKNYKSFLDEVDFSLEPAPKQKDLEYSLLVQKICNTVYKALSSAVIYGPNAAGKSNIIGAMSTLKAIIKRGNIRNSEEGTSNISENNLELIPNNLLKEPRPVEFYIKFIKDEILFEYNLKINIGKFILSKSDKRKILFEALSINNEMIFERNDKIQLGEISKLENFFPQFNGQNKETIFALIENSLNDEELFLTNGFKSIISPKLAKKAFEWFDSDFKIIYNSKDYRSEIIPQDCNGEEKLYVQKKVDEFAQYLGINSNHIGYLYKDNRAELTSIFSIDKFDKKISVPAEVIESMGTIRFINFLLPLCDALKNGKTLVIDEFDNSLHPMIIMNIINIFHNDNINKNRAQLIFNTHNPIFLNSNLYRRDEIKFIERDESGFSTQYSLAEVIDPCKKKIRAGADYMKNYFINRYGAIKNIDFEPLFKIFLSEDVPKLEKVSYVPQKKIRNH